IREKLIIMPLHTHYDILFQMRVIPFKKTGIPLLLILFKPFVSIVTALSGRNEYLIRYSETNRAL
ncbi:MAG: hypothetical protein ACK41Q_13375, partial [Candidatus Brocadia sp.]